MLCVFFIEIDCPQHIKYLVYLTRLKNEKSQNSHSIEEFNSITAASKKKVSYPAHIPYPQHHELASKFPSNTEKYDVFIPRKLALLVISGMRLKTGVCRKHRVVSRNSQ